MSATQLYRASSQLDRQTDDAPTGVPGKAPVTARLPGRPQTTIIFRVESADAARELAGAFGPRDRNGVAAGADAAVDRAASSSGQPLSGDVRTRFESSLGSDLSSVRVHTGAESAEAAHAVGARAYTTGQDIHFAAGQYDPQSAFGVHLLAHEVAHTVQQQGAAPVRQHKLEVSAPQDGAEVEADRAADAMVAGESARVGPALPGTARTLMRDDDGSVSSDLGDDAELDDGECAVEAPAALDWSCIAPVSEAPSRAWLEPPSYQDLYLGDDLESYRVAFDASWAEAQGSHANVVTMHETIGATEKQLPPFLRIADSAVVGVKGTKVNATDAFQGDRLAPGTSRIDSSKVPDGTQHEIEEVKLAIVTAQLDVAGKASAIADTNDGVLKAGNSLREAETNLKINMTDAELEQRALSKDQVANDLETYKADIAAALETTKALTSLIKVFEDPDPTAMVGNIIGAVDQGATAIAAVGEAALVTSANSKLAAIDASIGKLQRTKAGLAATNAQSVISNAIIDMRIARRAVETAINAYKAASLARDGLYLKLAAAVSKAGTESGMNKKDAQLVSAVVAAIPKIKQIIDFCGGLSGNLPTPAYNEASGIGAAMATNANVFQRNLGIVKGTDEYVTRTKATWQARLVSVEALIETATATAVPSDW